MVSFTVKYKGHAKQMHERADRFLPGFHASMTQLRYLQITYLMKHTPGYPDGEMANAYYVEGDSIFNAASYFEAVWQGRGIIRPRFKRALHFFIGGKEIFAMRAGPARPNPFVERAIDEFEEMLASRVEDFTTKATALVS